MKRWYVYIMANKPNGVTYIGMTDDIEERIKEHKLKIRPKSFTAKYNCDKLIYFEEYEVDEKAILENDNLKNGKETGK